MTASISSSKALVAASSIPTWTEREAAVRDAVKPYFEGAIPLHEIILDYYENRVYASNIPQKIIDVIIPTLGPLENWVPPQPMPYPQFRKTGILFTWNESVSSTVTWLAVAIMKVETGGVAYIFVDRRSFIDPCYYSPTESLEIRIEQQAKYIENAIKQILH